MASLGGDNDKYYRRPWYSLNNPDYFDLMTFLGFGSLFLGVVMFFGMVGYLIAMSPGNQ